MKSILLLVISIILISCKSKVEIGVSEDTNGIGLLYLDTNSPIYLYSDKKNKIPFDSIVFKNNKVKTSLLKNQLNPYYIYKGDSEKEAKENLNKGLIEFKSQIIFKVVEKDESFWSVIINEKESGFVYLNLEDYQDLAQSDYLKNNGFDPNFISGKIKKWYLYEDWLTHFRYSFITNSENLKVLNQPNGKMIQSKLSHFNIVDTIKDDWMKIKINDSVSGWVRWKNDDSILLEHTRFIYY